MESVELGSPAWIELAATYLREHVTDLGASTDGLDWSLCESFTDPPVHLDNGAGSVAWWFRIVGTNVTFGVGDTQDVDLYIRASYAEVLPRARSVNDAPTPEMRARAEQVRREALEAGLEPPPYVPPMLSELLRGLHNFLAVRTS